MIRKIPSVFLRFAILVCFFAFFVSPVWADVPREPPVPTERKKGCSPLNLAEIGVLFFTMGAAGCLIRSGRKADRRDDDA